MLSGTSLASSHVTFVVKVKPDRQWQRPLTWPSMTTLQIVKS